MARAVLRDGDVRHGSVGRELLTCKKSVHPGVKSLWEFHEAADPSRVTLDHNGCGAAIRVAPVGIRYRSDRLDDIVEGVHQASIPTHGGPLARAAAAATGAAISAAIDGADGVETLRFAQVAAEKAEQRRLGSQDFRVRPSSQGCRRRLEPSARPQSGRRGPPARSNSALDARAARDCTRDTHGLSGVSDSSCGEHRRRQ